MLVLPSGCLQILAIAGCPNVFRPRHHKQEIVILGLARKKIE